MYQSLKTSVQSEGVHGKPVVLIGIVTRNRAEILPQAIHSALAQSYPYVKITVLDDGSEDQTWTIQSEFPAIRWRRWESSRGLLEARNELMRTADADFYLSLDDDAWFIGTDEIATAVEHMKGNPRVAAVAFDILSRDRRQPVARSAPRPIHMFIGCGHMLRVRALNECGFYAPTLGFYGAEEKDLCLRLLDQNWEVDLLPGVHVWHDQTTLARDQAAQYRSVVSNDLVSALRRCPLPIVLAVLPYKLFIHLRFSIGRSLLRPCLAGFGLFFRHIFSVWGSRNPVRAGTLREFVRRSREAS